MWLFPSVRQLFTLHCPNIKRTNEVEDKHRARKVSTIESDHLPFTQTLLGQQRRSGPVDEVN